MVRAASATGLSLVSVERQLEVVPSPSLPPANGATTREIALARQQTNQDLIEQLAYQVKQQAASYQDRQMIQTATANHNATLATLAAVREEPRGSWAQKRADAWTDDAATISHRHQLGYVEAAGAQIAATAHRSVTPPPKEPSALERLLGKS